MTENYRPAPKFIRTETIYSLLAPVPALASVVFTVSGYLFRIADDPDGSKTFFVLALFAAVCSMIITFIALCLPRKKKAMAVLMFMISLAAAITIFWLTPDILQNLNFWTSPGNATDPTNGPVAP